MALELENDRLSDVRDKQEKDDFEGNMIKYFTHDILPPDDQDARQILLDQDQYVVDDNGLLFNLWVKTVHKN